MEKFFKFLQKNEKIICSSIVGSYITNKDTNNIDVIILINKIKDKKILLAEIESYLKINSFQNEDVFQFKTKTITYSFLIETFTCFKKKFKNICDGKIYKPEICSWAIVGWLPESFLLDLKNMLIIKDNQFFKDIKEELQEYPHGLKESIINFSNKKINELTMLLQTPGINRFSKKIAQVEKNIYLFRRQFAEKNKFLHSFKFKEKLCKKIKI